MSYAWIAGLNTTLEQSLNRKVKLPENGSVSVILRLEEPKVDSKVWEVGKPAKNSYVWRTADDRFLYASEKLSFEITEALKPYMEKLEAAGTTEVAVEIHNKGTKNKPIWVVIVKGGF